MIECDVTPKYISGKAFDVLCIALLTGAVLAQKFCGGGGIAHQSLHHGVHFIHMALKWKY